MKVIGSNFESERNSVIKTDEKTIEKEVEEPLSIQQLSPIFVNRLTANQEKTSRNIKTSQSSTNNSTYQEFVRSCNNFVKPPS